MFIKYEDCGDNIIVNVPDSLTWKICYKLFDEAGNEDCNLYLIVGEETILLRDAEYWCQGRTNLPYSAVGDLYEEIVNVIGAKIENEPNLRIIDISSIESKLLEDEFEKKWIEKGYVDVYPDGSW
jgi:hypothetical protein